MITRLKLSTIEQGLPKYRSMLAGNDAYIPSSFESIASSSPNGATVTFSSIPGTYQHLQIRYNGRASNTGTYTALIVEINSDTGSNYAYHWLEGNGANPSADGASSMTYIYPTNLTNASTAASTFSAGIIDIHDYASTSKTKTIRCFGGYDANGSGYLRLSSGLWNSTSAITSIKIYPFGSTWANGTTVSLYGIKG